MQKRFKRIVEKPYTLLQGDCLELMSNIPDESVDLIVTDPAYKGISGGITTGYSHGILQYKKMGKFFDHNSITASEFIPDFFRVLRPNSHCYIMTNNLNMFDLYNQALKVGFKFHNFLVWKKNNCTMNHWYMKNLEYTLLFYKSKAFPINDRGSKQCFECNNVREKTHPTQKPIELMEHYISNSSQLSEVVLDPMMGSGTTGVAALNLGRRFIGIELDPNYFQIAKERIENRL